MSGTHRGSPCLTWQDKPKKPYTFEEAVIRARLMSEEQQRPVGAYRCRVCDWFHIGHARKRAHPLGPYSEALMAEVGARVLGCMADELRDVERALWARVRGGQRRMARAA